MASVLLTQLFVSWRSRCRCRRGFRELPKIFAWERLLKQLILTDRDLVEMARPAKFNLYLVRLI